MKQCHKCGTEWVSEKRQPAFKDFCSKCTAYLHCCKNCRFHDPRLHNQCQIPTTEWVSDRAGCNFCEDFEFRDSIVASKADSKKAQARDAFSDLFGEGADDKPDEGADAFDKLFGD